MQILVLAVFGPIPDSSRAWGRYERPRLEKRCINQRRLAGETNSKAQTIKYKILSYVLPSSSFWGRRDIVEFWGLGGPGGRKKPYEEVGRFGAT